MRISDWSSDVCSSDLIDIVPAGRGTRDMAPPKNRRPGFSRRAQYGLFLGYVIAVAGALVGAILLVVSAIDPTGFASLRMAAAEATAPVSTAFSSVTRGLVSIPQAIGDHFGTVSENRRLKKQIADNRELLMRSEEHTSELQSLMRISYAV